MPEFEQAAIEDEESAAMRAEHLLEDDNPAIIDAPQDVRRDAGLRGGIHRCRDLVHTLRHRPEVP